MAAGQQYFRNISNDCRLPLCYCGGSCHRCSHRHTYSYLHGTILPKGSLQNNETGNKPDGRHSFRGLRFLRPGHTGSSGTGLYRRTWSQRSDCLYPSGAYDTAYHNQHVGGRHKSSARKLLRRRSGSGSFSRTERVLGSCSCRQKRDFCRYNTGHRQSRRRNHGSHNGCRKSGSHT